MEGNVNTRPVFDGHNDFLHTSYLPGFKKRSFFRKNESGHLDMPRAKAGGFCGGFFAIFFPHPVEVEFFTQYNEGDHVPFDLFEKLEPVDHSYALSMAIKGIDIMHSLEAESNRNVRIVHNVEDIRNAMNQGAVSAIIHFEGAEPIDKNLDNLDAFYVKGLRSLGIVWSRLNDFGQGVNFKFPGTPDQGPGLSAAGRELVLACNRLGILIDLSHLNEKGFWDIEKISDAPLVATHSCVHTLCQMPRNVTDKQLDAIASSGGLIGINFGVRFIRKDGKQVVDTPIIELVRHFQYVADRIGVDHVAIGSDFDGTTIMDDIKDVSGLPILMDALEKNGFDESALEKIAYKNWMRVLGKTWK